MLNISKLYNFGITVCTVSVNVSYVISQEDIIVYISWFWNILICGGKAWLLSPI